MIKNEYTEIGKFGKTIGLKGNISINLFNKEVDPDNFYSKLFIKKVEQFVFFEVEKIILTNSKVTLKLQGIDTKEAATQLINYTVFSDQVDFSDKTLKKNEYFYEKIIGSDVLDANLNLIGKITDVVNTGPYEVFQIINSENKEMMVPSVKEMVAEIREGALILTQYGCEVANIC